MLRARGAVAAFSVSVRCRAAHRLQACGAELQLAPTYTAPAVYKETGAASVVPPPNPAGGGWQPATPSDGMLRGKWWEIYQDPNSTGWKSDTPENQTLRPGAETYLAARDQVRAARASFYPTFSAGFGAAATSSLPTVPWQAARATAITT